MLTPAFGTFLTVLVTGLGASAIGGTADSLSPAGARPSQMAAGDTNVGSRPVRHERIEDDARVCEIFAKYDRTVTPGTIRCEVRQVLAPRHRMDEAARLRVTEAGRERASR